MFRMAEDKNGKKVWLRKQLYKFVPLPDENMSNITLWVGESEININERTYFLSAVGRWIWAADDLGNRFLCLQHGLTKPFRPLTGKAVLVQHDSPAASLNLDHQRQREEKRERERERERERGESERERRESERERKREREREEEGEKRERGERERERESQVCGLIVFYTGQI